MRTSALVSGFGTPVTNIRSPIEPTAFFFFKTGADLIALGTGSTFDIANDDLIADIGLTAVKTMHTEIVPINETSFVPGVCEPVKPYFFRNSSGILAEKSGNVLKRTAVIQ